MVSEPVFFNLIDNFSYGADYISQHESLNVQPVQLWWIIIVLREAGVWEIECWETNIWVVCFH